MSVLMGAMNLYNTILSYMAPNIRASIVFTICSAYNLFRGG